MPVYDQSYRSHVARAPLRRLRFWPITREGLRLLLAKRALLMLGMLAWLPFVVFAAMVFAIARFPEVGRLLPLDGTLFGRFLDWQTGFVLLLTIFGGAGLIAEDLRSGAIVVYLSRPLTRRDYLLGKLGVLLALNLAVTLVPGLALWAVALGLHPSSFATLELAWVPFAVALQGLLMSLAFSLVVLALSALSRSARVAGLAFVALIVGLEIARGVLQVAFRVPLAALLSLRGDVDILREALFGIDSARLADVGWPAAAAVLLLAAGASLLAIRARVRAVEVV